MGYEPHALTVRPPRLIVPSSDHRQTTASMSSSTSSPTNQATQAKSRSPIRGVIKLGVFVAMAASAVFGAMTLAERLPLGGFLQEGSLTELTHTVKRDSLRVTVTEQGTIESSENTEIKCRVRGFSTVTWIIEGGARVEPGDELVRLDTKRVEDAISKHTTESHTARATLERSIADLKQAELAEAAYLEGEYKTQKQRMERELKVASTNLETAEKMLANSRSMFNRGYVTRLEVESNEFTVTQAKLELEVKQTELEVLEKYTKKMRLETIRGSLLASEAKRKADESGLAMDEGRRDRALRELDMCVIKAESSGMVIYPSAAAWKDTPDVAEGAVVRRDQTLLLMPDLEKMQVKVGVHESMIDKVHIGQQAQIRLPDLEVAGKVTSVASVARPAGWWTGNVVKYDVIVDIPPSDDLKPGMSAEVELVLSEHEDVLTIPVAAILETEDGAFCWVKQDDGFQRQPLLLGDGNEVFVIVKNGVTADEQVALNPQAFLDDASLEMQGAGVGEPMPNGEETRTVDRTNASDPTKIAPTNGDPNKVDATGGPGAGDE